MPKYVVFVYDGLDHHIIPADIAGDILDENPNWSMSSQVMNLEEAENLILNGEM